MILILLALLAQAAPQEAVLRGRVVRFDPDSDRDAGPAAGVRVRGTGAAGLMGEGTSRTARMPAVVSGPDGRFELAMPPAFAEAVRSRAGGGWWIDLEAEDDDVLEAEPTALRELEDLDDIVVHIRTPDPKAVDRVREVLERLRTSPQKARFTHGLDVGAHLGGRDDAVLSPLYTAASWSRAGRRLLQEHQKDPDPNVRALAYEILAFIGASEDDAGRDADDPRRRLEWAVGAVGASRHGGHLALGVDLDDVCSRCYTVYELAHEAARALGADAAKAVFAGHPVQSEQAGILRRLALDGLQKAPETDPDQLAARPDFPLPPEARVDGEALLVPETRGLKLVRPERDARPVSLPPSWMRFSDPTCSPDGRLLGIGGLALQDSLWILDLRTLRGSVVSWGGLKHLSARWLPDGRRVAFLRLREHDPGRELRVFDPAARTSRTLLSAETLHLVAMDPVSPRALVRTEKPHLLDLETGALDPVEAGDGAVWSPDGTRLAFVRNLTLEVLDVAERRVRAVAKLTSYQAPLAWSPDGRHIAYVAVPAWKDEASKGRLMRAALDGTPARVVAEVDGELGLYAPAWSPDGRRIAFVAAREGRPWIHVVSADGETLFGVCEGGELGTQVVVPALQWRLLKPASPK